VHSTEKALSEHGAKVGEGERRAIETALADLKEALKGDDADAITAKMNALAQVSMKLGEAMYKQADGPPGAGGAEGGGPGASKRDDVVDAEFTEVDDDKKNKNRPRTGFAWRKIGRFFAREGPRGLSRCAASERCLHRPISATSWSGCAAPALSAPRKRESVGWRTAVCVVSR